MNSQTVMSSGPGSRRCLKIHPTLLPAGCPYNYTSMDESAQNASLKHILDLEPLHASQCSRDSRLLACTTFLPLCDPIHPMITAPPCRHLCLAVQSSCLKLFRAVNLPWPAIMNCSALPDAPQLCVSSSQVTAAPSSSSTQSPSTPLHSLSTSPPNTSFAPPHLALFISLPTGLVIFSLSVVIVVICKCFCFRPKLPQPGPVTVTLSASPLASRPLPAPPLQPRAIPPYATSRPFSAPLYANIPVAEPNYANASPASPSSPFAIAVLHAE